MLALLICACSKDCFPAMRRFSVSNHGPDIKNLSLFAFRKSDGMLEGASNSSRDSVSIRLVSGREYNLYLLANAPKDFSDSISQENEYLRERTSLSENDPSSPLLFCSNLSYKAPEQEPVLELKRFLCRISIGSISVEWPTGTPCTIETIMLINACESTPLSGIPDGMGPRLNCPGAEDALDDSVRDKLVWEGITRINDCSEVILDREFFSMPDPYGKTSLAVRINIAGCDNWYPVSLPQMDCNHDYRINCIVIKGPGSEGPGEDVSRESVSYVISVQPWESSVITVDF